MFPQREQGHNRFCVGDLAASGWEVVERNCQGESKCLVIGASGHKIVEEIKIFDVTRGGRSTKATNFVVFGRKSRKEPAFIGSFVKMASSVDGPNNLNPSEVAFTTHSKIREGRVENGQNHARIN
ncbi:hypothetical protein, unlikely [Trypanosoma brucei brucei TREU927]|uniref:Uncharacterized protein n=1 Tax=Trypanosoma brucei brucei (strain 927/4 GUTat10.1) TaxID=185431 RepID=Q38EL5_TRYB2|nr:hypothetical protein, unlikely [Trypanosoma brucei brucei TREU927]EAN76755.1 hypothetical protein, unlikely [Trypanosoma brucei brucei TREU927]